MSKNELMNKLSRSYNLAALKVKKNSPVILVAVGVVGVVTAGVMACKATTKLDEVMKKHNEQKEKINDYFELNGPTEEYTENDHNKDLAITYAHTGLELAKLYGPSIAVGALSIGAIVWSNRILTKRNVALSAAYTIVSKDFKEYRDRVIERFGKDLDRELRYNIKAKEVEEIVTDEDGNETVVKEVVNTAEVHDYSEFARIYDCGNTGWTKDPETNMLVLKQTERYFNDILKCKGYVFLNEVYEELGFPPTKAGQIVGWIYDEKNPVGDNYIDFGIFDINHEATKRFVNGYESSIVLDFNVDGNILDMI